MTQPDVEKQDPQTGQPAEQPDAVRKPTDSAESDKTPPPSRSTNGNSEGLRIDSGRRRANFKPDTTKETPLWERDDAPDGSTESSLLHYDENGRPDRVSGPTHYAHLANGTIVGSYGIGTHHDDGDGPVPVVAHFAG